MCDGCDTGESIVGSRLVCVDCGPTQTTTSDTYDLCMACFCKHVHAQVPAHRFILLRTVKMHTYQLASLERAKMMLSQMRRRNRRPSDRSPPCCAECKGPLALEKSHWQCLDCSG